MDIYIVLTGRKGHGKDTLADIAIEKFDCAGKVALADWFKEELSNEFKIPLKNFYDVNLKDKPLEKPVVVQRRNIRNLLLKIGEYGFMNVNRISTMKWEGRRLNSIREMMLWFGHEFVTKSCGDTFHCQVTHERKIPLIPRKPNHANIIFITDARKHKQSKYFVDRYKYVFPVKIVRPGGSNDGHFVETSVDNFPEGYFFAEVSNDGDLKDLEKQIKKLLLSIKQSITGEKSVKKPVSTKRSINSKVEETTQEESAEAQQQGEKENAI